MSSLSVSTARLSMKVLFVLFIDLLPVPVISNVQEHEQMNKVIDVKRSLSVLWRRYK